MLRPCTPRLMLPFARTLHTLRLRRRKLRSIALTRKSSTTKRGVNASAKRKPTISLNCRRNWLSLGSNLYKECFTVECLLSQCICGFNIHSNGSQEFAVLYYMQSHGSTQYNFLTRYQFRYLVCETLVRTFKIGLDLIPRY